jgi:hypothetical protein
MYDGLEMTPRGLSYKAFKNVIEIPTLSHIYIYDQGD